MKILDLVRELGIHTLIILGTDKYCNDLKYECIVDGYSYPYITNTRTRFIKEDEPVALLLEKGYKLYLKRLTEYLDEVEIKYLIEDSGKVYTTKEFEDMY